MKTVILWMVLLGNHPPSYTGTEFPTMVQCQQKKKHLEQTWGKKYPGQANWHCVELEDGY